MRIVVFLKVFGEFHFGFITFFLLQFLAKRGFISFLEGIGFFFMFGFEEGIVVHGGIETTLG